MTDWVYPDYFSTLTAVANWVATASGICCVFLLLSWLALPVDKTNRHYLSVCLTVAVLVMNVSSHTNERPSSLTDGVARFHNPTCRAARAVLRRDNTE